MASVSPTDGSATGTRTVRTVPMRAQSSAVSVTCFGLELLPSLLCRLAKLFNLKLGISFPLPTMKCRLSDSQVSQAIIS